MEETTESVIRVVAPATLEEGYAFDVLVDDEPFTVVVPAGGVKEGEEFCVPFGSDAEMKENSDDGSHGRAEDDADTKSNDMHALTDPLPSGSADEDEELFDELGTPLGRWRSTLCSCCDVMTQSTCWMGIFCAPVLIAQLLHRLKLTWKGQAGPMDEAALAFNRIVIGFVIALTVSKVPFLGSIVLFGYYVYVITYVGSNLRQYIRRKYRIPASLPTRIGETVDDCCCMFFCCCCSTIQMARHTHDDKEFPGHGCTTSGLGIDAPEL